MTIPLLIITVYGAPITQGSKTRTEHGLRDDNAGALKPWREAVKNAALDHVGGLDPDDRDPYPIVGPVRVEVTFTLAKPTTAPKRRRVWPIKQRSGDVDKLVRAVFDSLTDAGVWGDDAQVVVVLARKTYPHMHQHALDRPGARILIWDGDQ